MKSKSKVLLIGWDAAEWKVIHDLIDKGLMPNVENLIAEGASGNIKTLDPPLSPMLWTSIATGKLADKHGVLGFVETNEKTKEANPVSSHARKCHAIWNILNQQGYRSNIINWWPSNPVDPINGVMVSNFFPKEHRNEKGEWLLGDFAVHPPEISEELAKLRVPSDNIVAEDILKLVPEADKIDQKEDGRLGRLQKYIAETLSVQKVAERLIAQPDWDFTAVYFDSLDKLSHTFMKLRAPQMKRIADDEFELYQHVMDGIYIMFDTMLGHLLQKIDDNTTVVLLSDHGFHADELRPNSLPKHNAAIALEHNPNGVLIMKGPQVNVAHPITGANLLDITPTLLRIFDLPIGEDMDGKVLEACLDKTSSIKYIESWEKEAGDFGRNTNEINSEHIKEATQQLIDLGYIESVKGDDALLKISKDAKYNLSQVYATSERIEEAIELLEELYKEDKVDSRWNIDLITFHLKLDQIDRAKEVFKNFQKFNIEKKVNMELFEGMILQKENKHLEAVKIYQKMISRSPNYTKVYFKMAGAYRSADKFNEAAETYEKILSIKPSASDALHGLAVVKMRQKDFESAIDYCLKTIESDYTNSSAHYHFGKSLYELKMYKEAAHALEVCLTINPGVNRARNLLINIYKEQTKDIKKSVAHQQILDDNEKGTINIVSGLPRSGTSMMMQLLEAGGLEMLTDNIRKPDESNPKGYYEYEPVKRSASDVSWLPQAKGKTVKVIAQLLRCMANRYNYKVVFMLRNLDDVMLSQETMLTKIKSGKKTINYNLTLINEYKEGLKEIKLWEEQRNNVEILYIEYEEVIKDPKSSAIKINNFFDEELDTNKMAAVVDKNLYRIKTQKA